MGRMPRGEHRSSILLSRDENEQVFSLIGPKCQSLATAVVQLFTTEGPAHSEWKKKDTGVLCLIKDNGRRSYFFRIYCLYRKAMIWEHEVYLQIEYKSPRPYLHTFEAEDYMTAFNFANEDEAKILKDTLIERIELRKQKREERRQRSMLAARANSSASQRSIRHNGVAAPPPAPSQSLPTPQPVKAPSSITGGYTLKGKKPKARKLTKADIGFPKDFQHISHVGWDANKGFDVDLPEEEMRSFFSKAGISDKQLQDRDTREFIYDFINTHGGIDAVKDELHEVPRPIKNAVRYPAPQSAPPAPPAPPVPSRAPSNAHTHAHAHAHAHAHPPAPPSRAPPPPPARAVPPPPPPSLAAPRNPPPRPPQPLPAPASLPPAVPPPPPPGVPPPPPPAPPAPPAPPPPPPPSTAATIVAAAPVVDARAALMESIRSGNKQLKHVEVGSKTSLNDDSRSNLLSEIRRGVDLKSVSRSTSSSGERARPEGPVPACGLAEALARALNERNRAIHSSDSEESDADSDGEWDE